MYVDYSGWSEEKGYFLYTFFINEAATDYEIHYENGFVAKQTSDFTTYTYDWNHDGDVYSMFGAWFESRHGGNDFFTPEELVNALVDSVMGEDLGCNDRMEFIKGIDFPPGLVQKTDKSPTNFRKGR